MLPPNTYKVDDFETIRQTIFDDALNSLSNRFPLENDKYRLTVEDLGYDSIPKYTTLQQKEAVQSDKTLSAKIKGRWTLYDKNTGKIVSQSSRKTIMDVPYMTERGTFIRNGTEMTLPIQMRLVPGVYARMTDSGEAKAHINVKPGSGSQLSITMNPANPVFKVTQGTRNYKLYPLLKHMGISDEYLMNAWGKDIYKANYDDFISGGGWYSAKTAAEENPYDEITKRVFRGDLDPLETEASLGKGYKTVDPDMMVAAASKLLRISKGEAESDNRDSLENQRFLMAPELIGERVRLDAGKVGQTLLWKISRSGDVNKIPAGALNKYINGLFTESRLAQAIEETNPLDAYMRATKVTRMGEGGISGVDTAPMSARLVHNTYKGFIDPTVSPECCANHLVMSNLGWVEISKVTEDTLVACLIDGKLEYHKPYKVVSYDFNGELYCYNAKATAYEVTGNHRMWSRLDAFSDYTFEFAENIFNTHRIFWSGADTYTDDSKTEITIFANTPDETYHFKKPYVGKVYCLSVPGGLFYTKLPGKRPFWIGNSLRAGLDSAIALNAVKGKDGFMYTPMINAISGRREYVNSLVASKVPVAFSEYRDSTQKYIPAMVGNKIEYLPKANVKYFIPNGDSLFALSSNLIPLKSGIKAGRLLMAQKHQTQAVSLSSRMAPYVQTEHPGDNTISVEKSIGKLMGAVFSKGDGKVLSVTPDEMTVRYNDGTKETISLYNNYPLNRKSYYHNESRVKPGDIIKKGQVLASSNYTDENGVSALGTQLRTAWMPFKGENYLDAIIVSEDAAKKLSSEHLYHTGVDKDSTTTIDKNAYTSAFPTKFNKDQLATIDKDGIVKPGTTVKFGDPLILSYSKREATPGSLHRALVKDNVVTWEHEFPGYITDVVNSSKGVKVYTKAYLPLQTGDKCFSEDTDLLTNTGWKNIKDITLNDKIATLNPETNCFEYLYPDSLHKIPYNGPMYTIDTPQLKTCVTPYHNNFVQKRYSDHFELVKASDCFNKRVSFKKDGIWNGVDTPTFTWPNGTKVDMDSVLILLGLFIAGESITLDNSIYNYLNTYRDHIPAFIFDLSIRQQKLFFDCLLNKKSIFTTKYKQLADDIQRLCLHIGLTATIKAGSIYRVIISHNTTPIVNSAIYTNYNGYVYCPTMPKWNVVYSRRNGVPVWSGNCAARYANKGVTARVVPTSEMPIAADGKPIDVIFGPTGIVSRVNSAQLVEAMLGKVAAKTGKRYVLPGFMNENMVEFAKRELEQAGLTDREDLTDPTTGITIPQITVGNSYIVKMHHTAESKGGARATGAYTMDELPGGQGHDGSKLLGNLILGAIIGHGCFVGSTNILTDHGYMEIGNIVKHRLPVNVYSYNKDTDTFEYRPVTNWFVYSVDDSEMWEIHTTARSGIESTKGRGIAGSHRAIHCTKDHKFYTLDRGLVEASKLVEGDTVLTIGDSITDWQKQIIYGTLMGDGYSLRGTLRITHGPKQLTYNEWLYSKLKPFCNNSPIIKEQKSGFGKSVQSRLVTRSVGWISQIANEFYHTNKKTVPNDIITKMGWPGIGIWFADDGSCDNHKGKTHSYSFHTCAFTIQECELLISALNEFTGLIWSLVLKSGKYPIIRLNTRSIRDDQLSKFAKMIAPYLPPGFEYKLGDRYTSDLNYDLFWVDKVPSDHIDKPEVCFVKRSAPYIRPDYDTSLVYDITVEHNHNFIAAGVLVSNSTEVLKDMKLVKGQKNTDFWRDFKLGRTPVMPSTPLIYEKFLASLQGAGINVHKEKNTTNIFALTNKDINDFAHAEVKNSDTYSANNMAPLPGGLFDPNIFGPNGTQWGYIKLDEPVLNPVMEDPIKLILGLTEADLEAVISGNKKLPNGLTGGLGLKKQLESINMKQAVQDALNDVKNATRTKRDKAVKKYRYLSSMLKHNASPADFMLDKIPVIPPRFRRISQSGDLTMVADANYLYRALMDNQQDVRDARNAGLPEDMVGSGNLKIYKAFKAITGLSDPEDRKLQEKQVSGLLKWVFGKGSPKCYDSETEILTENGWVKFPEYLDSTIKVATLNPSTDAFEWQTPTDIIHMPYSGDMIYTHTRYLDSMVTPNHNHYVSLRTGKGINSRWTPFAKEQASNLVDVVKRVRYKTAASKYIGSTPNTFDITPNANAFATFIGWYAAEGWIHTDNTIVYIAVKAHGRDESILTDLFDNNAFKYKKAYYTTKAAKVSPYGIKTPAGYEMVYFSFYSKELCQWLRDNVGASCYTKHLSSEILGWSSEYLINVWEGFHAGDGEKRSGLITTNSKKTWQSRKSFTDRGNRAYTVSKDLAESFVELGLKIGASVNYVKNKELYRISVHAFDYSVAEYRHQTSNVPYEGMVHCVTVPNGLVFVRRNGRVLVSGNSGAYQRNVVGGSLDVAGRNVITPNASFRLDEIGLPKKEAWTLYQDFVIRRLVQNGMDPLVATKEVTNKTKLAEDALRQVVSERPVLATRAPALHKYSIMAFRPRLVESETLQLNPAIQKPFNADHDGDSQVGRVIVRFKRNIDVPFKYRLDF